MANIEDCPGFESFGADVKAARKARRLSRRALAEIVNIDNRYLANIENEGTIPSLPVIIQLIKACGLPVERYFNPEIMREESEQRQRVSHKLKPCPEQYLSIIEGAIDGAIQTEQPEKNEETEDVYYEAAGKTAGLSDGTGMKNIRDKNFTIGSCPE
ncbi:transcriptional regulator with XRE-family HTH domain [Allofournierella massiliensis]|uniref:Transcriptional regulator with XRE-family HTH domain n=1 Tax=Allofournierella massiliensis TaxID=1650663 RepID=A0A4R1QRV2_9FIRM|nr:transcriptional regulator with XRE-family HTH domain [Fournierella massiliensis]